MAVMLMGPRAHGSGQHAGADAAARAAVAAGDGCTGWRTTGAAGRGTAISSFLAPLLYLGAMGYGLGALVRRAAPRGAVRRVRRARGAAATAMQIAAGEAMYPVLGA
jgi:lipooligosaccharide transport system permease protein